MCVIMMVGKTRPTDEMITRAWNTNKDGGGVAWWEGEGKKREVVWKKGIMKLEEMREILHRTPLPYVAHFRVASVGGVLPTLTHPFGVDVTASIELEGRTPGAVLFHNGHWGNWSDRAMEAAINSNNQIPVGDWSDTRAIAWMSYIYGPGFFELLPSQRGIYMDTQKMEVFTGGGWEQINDVWCSNDHFWTRNRSHGTHQTTVYGRMCERGKCTNKAQAGRKICLECEALDTISQSKSDTKSNTSDDDGQGKVNEVSLITGGDINRPLVGVLTLREAEALHAQKKVSKNKIKNFRKAWFNLAKGGNREARAKKQLREYSTEIARTLLHGSGG